MALAAGMEVLHMRQDGSGQGASGSETPADGSEDPLAAGHSHAEGTRYAEDEMGMPSYAVAAWGLSKTTQMHHSIHPSPVGEAWQCCLQGTSRPSPNSKCCCQSPLARCTLCTLCRSTA